MQTTEVIPSRREEVMDIMSSKIKAANKAVNEILLALEEEFADVGVRIVPICRIDDAYKKENGGVVQLQYTMR